MTNRDILMLYVLPISAIIFAVIAVSVGIYFTYKRKENPIPAVIATVLCILFILLAIFSINNTHKQFTQAENATLLYEDIRIYTDNDTGEYFYIGYDENEEYCRYYLNEETVQRMRDYTDGKIKKANNLDIFIDENGKYVVFDKNFNEAGTITIS